MASEAGQIHELEGVGTSARTAPWRRIAGDVNLVPFALEPFQEAQLPRCVRFSRAGVYTG